MPWTRTATNGRARQEGAPSRPRAQPSRRAARGPAIAESARADAGSPRRSTRCPTRERCELGIEHALVGAVLVRRWALSPNVAAAIEHHHSPKATGHAATIRLADLVVHFASGDPTTPDSIVQAAGQLGLGPRRGDAASMRVSALRRRAQAPLGPLPAVGPLDLLRGLAESRVQAHSPPSSRCR